MEKQVFYNLFEASFVKNNLQDMITPRIVDMFYALTVHMMEVNEVMNLTAIRDVEKIIPLHYADCLKIVPLFPQNATVMDVGCGGGFPILPLAIARPDLLLTGVDSTAKKSLYVSETAQKLGLANVTTITARAEELAHDPQVREKFHVVTSRAVARLNVLDELCLPFVKNGGKFIVMKGSAGDEELSEAQKGIKILGGHLERIIRDDLYTTGDMIERRMTFVIEKKNPTPENYPRSFGQIKKKPL